MLLVKGLVTATLAFLIFTCTEVGGKEGGKSNNFKLCPPNVGCDLSEVVVLRSKGNGRWE